MKTAWAVIALLMISCQVQAANPAPATPTAPSQWRELSDSVDKTTLFGNVQFEQGFPDKAWWGTFQDPHLQACIEQVMAHNHTLAQAQARVAEARAMVKIARAGQLPQATVGADWTLQTYSQNQLPFLAGSQFQFFNTPLQPSYEVDLWGFYRKQTESAKKGVEVAQLLQRSLLVQLASDTAAAYLNLIQSDDMLRLQQQLVDLANKEYAKAQRLQAHGLAANEQVLQAKTQLELKRTLYSQWEQVRSLSLNQLAVLMGKTPAEVGNLPRTALNELPFTPSVPTGLPSELVTHRPDVQAAEKAMEQARINVSVVRRAFLPTVNVSGNVGFSPDISREGGLSGRKALL
jgi:multidrug efflux system outer membrane protein